MRHLLLAATALAMLSGAAYAQNSQSTSHSTATANTRSSSRAAAVGNTTNVNVGGYTGDPSSGTGTTDPSGSLNYGGSYTVRNTPEVIPPSVVGGNACAVGASGGLSMAGFGIAGGATWADKACERRQQAALLFNMGEKNVAYEMMCQDDNVRTAMRAAGKPCIADTRPAAQAVAPAMAAKPAAVITEVAQIPAPAPVRPEYCYTASPTELQRHNECDVR